MISEVQVLNLFERHCEGIKSTGGSQYTSLCPFHDDTHHSFSFNTESTQYFCHACDKQGNAVKFAKAKGEDAKPFYDDRFKTVKNGVKAEEQTRNKHNLRKKAEAYKSNVPYGDDLIQYQKNMVGKDKEGRMTFPYFSQNGIDVIGIKHHKSKDGGQPYWEGDGKCKWYGDWNIKEPTDRIYIVEGEPDKLLMAENGKNAISGSAGAKSIPKYIPECLHNTREVLILFDNDDAGRNGAKKYAEELHHKLDAKILIGEWREGLPNKYDISDSKLGDEFKYAIENATEYKPHITKKEILGVNDYMELDVEKTERIVKYLVDSGSMTLIGGDTGVGKSWLALNLALDIASGQSHMGFFETKESKVLLAQFELTDDQVQRRLKSLKHHYKDNWDKVSTNLTIMPRGCAFQDQWQPIRELVNKHSLQGTVIIVDNLYSSVSTELNVSDNNDIMKILGVIDKMEQELGLTIILITHHLKHTAEKLITKDDILGGTSLTRHVSNIFQIKKSVLSGDYKVGKITKVRDEECLLEDKPFKMHFNEGHFQKGAIITNEILHFQGDAESWEIKLLKELKNYVDGVKGVELDREYLRTFLTTEQGWENMKPTTMNTKITRLLKKWEEWGLVKKDYNKYKILESEIFEQDA